MRAKSPHLRKRRSALARKPRATRATARPTIHEVSKLAGVSRMTVSRVIRGLAMVLPETRTRVEKAISELGYVPDRAAGSLSSRRSGFIALILPTLTNTNFAAAAHGLTEVLRPAGYHLLIAYTNYSAAEEDRQLSSLLERRPEAIVVTGATHSRAATRILLASGIPIIEIADIPRKSIGHVVGFSNFEAGRSAARHLIQRGYRRLAAVASTNDGDAIDHRGEERMRGFEDVVRNTGIGPPLVLRHGLAPVSYDHGTRVAALLLAQSPRVDAVFAVSDLSAVGIVMECQRRGLHVPRDLAVIGFGDFEIGREINPPLSTIHVDFHVLGQRAGLLIREVLQQDPPGKPRLIDVGISVMERESVGMQPIGMGAGHKP